MTYLQDIIGDLLGTYSPIYEFDPNTGDMVASVNYGYIATAAIFAIVVWSLLRIIGGLICSNR